MSNYNFHTGGYCSVCLHPTGACTCFQDLIKINKKIEMEEKLKNVCDESSENTVNIAKNTTQTKLQWGVIVFIIICLGVGIKLIISIKTGITIG